MLCRATLFLFVGLLLFLQIGCGSGSQTTSSTANPAASTPASSNPPAGSSQPPTPPAPTPTPTPTPASSDSYLAVITLTIGKNPTNHGQVTIDTTANNGAGSLQLNNVGFTNVQLQFCPQGVNSACTNVGAPFSADASGNATVNFTFPEKGTFSGVWQIVNSGCTNGCQDAASTIGNTGVGFMSAELPAGSISGGIGQATGNAPGSGKMTVTNSVAHLTLTGTTASHTFHVSLCGDPQGLGCMALSDVTTDASGNASADVGTIQPFGSSVFEVTDSAGVEFISAFRVQ